MGTSAAEFRQAAGGHARVLVARAQRVHDAVERLEPRRDGRVGVGDVAEVQAGRQGADEVAGVGKIPQRGFRHTGRRGQVDLASDQGQPDVPRRHEQAHRGDRLHRAAECIDEVGQQIAVDAHLRLRRPELAGVLGPPVDHGPSLELVDVEHGAGLGADAIGLEIGRPASDLPGEDRAVDDVRGVRPAVDVRLDGLPGEPRARGHPGFVLLETVPQVERHHLLDPEPEVGPEQVDGHRVAVRAADLLDASSPLDREGAQAEVEREVGSAQETIAVHASREHRVVGAAPLVVCPLLGGPHGQAARADAPP